MNVNKRPISVLIVASAYVAIGVIGLVSHLPKLLAAQPDSIWVELTELLAIVCGAFLLRGKNWARWLALAWIAFHVAQSVVYPPRGLVVHSLAFVVIAWILLRPAASRYFRRV